MKKIVSFAVMLAFALGCLGTFPAAAAGQPQTVKKYYVNTSFEGETEAAQWDGWVVRDDSDYPASNARLETGASYRAAESDNRYAAFTQTASDGWMITKTLSDTMTGVVTFEMDINPGTVENKVSRNLFAISQGGATGQIPLLATSYGFFLSPKVSASQPQVKLFPLGKNGDWVHVKIVLDFATGEIAYYFNGGEKVTVSGDGTNTAVPGSIAGDTFQTKYKYNTIKMYGAKGAALETNVMTTGLDNIQIYYEETETPPEPEEPRSYYINTDFTGAGDAAWGDWTVRDTTAQPKANAAIVENGGDPYASFTTNGSGGWFISAESPRVFTGEVTFETRIHYSGMGTNAAYNRNLFVISDSDDGQVALMNNSKSNWLKTAINIGGAAGANNSQYLKKITETEDDQKKWFTLKAIVNFDTGEIRYSVDGEELTADGNNGTALKTNLKETASNFDISKPYHTVKLYMAAGADSTTDVDYIKIYKTSTPCEANAYLVSTAEEKTTYKRLYHLQPGLIEGAATLNNTGTGAIRPVVFMALYKDGNLVDVNHVQPEEAIAPGDIQEVKCRLELSLAEGESIAPYEIRMFVWEDLQMIKPMHQAPLRLLPDCADEGVS